MHVRTEVLNPPDEKEICKAVMKYLDWNDALTPLLSKTKIAFDCYWKWVPVSDIPGVTGTATDLLKMAKFGCYSRDVN